MLTRNGLPFTTGSADFRDKIPGSREATSKVYVTFRLPFLPGEFVAQLDTGAAWSILSREVAEAAEVAFGLPDLTIATRLGDIRGHHVRLPMALRAEEGNDLELEATFFVSRDWPGDNFLGYSGLLEHIRFALDAPANRFHFGAADDNS